MPTLTISESTYLRLKQIAAARRIPMEQFLEQVAGGALDSAIPAGNSGTSEWMEAFNAWVASHPARAIIADDSREAVYGDEDD